MRDRTPRSDARTGYVDVTLVRAPACHFCADAHTALTTLAEKYPLQLHLVALESEDGARLVASHRPAMNPLVLVDGRFFSAGRLPVRKLTRLLERLTGPARKQAS